MNLVGMMKYFEKQNQEESKREVAGKGIIEKKFEDEKDEPTNHATKKEDSPCKPDSLDELSLDRGYVSDSALKKFEYNSYQLQR